MIRITPDIVIHDTEIHFDHIRASGPGGQHVNKVATAVQLRFDLSGSPSLSESIKARLTKAAGKRINNRGELVIRAGRYRSQELNRRDALSRLAELIVKASVPRQRRRVSRPTRASRERMLAAKRRRSAIKQMRRRVKGPDGG
ncbi:MAG: alternative ribosome rescue aminoacyl-tRNA hydrolase ArfB [Desulfobacterales bacterium]|jgi:ribosome-associated protein